jgi:hypothetical protein
MGLLVAVGVQYIDTVNVGIVYIGGYGASIEVR